MALGKPIKGKASKVGGSATRPLGNTTPTNPLDDRADNLALANREKGKSWGKTKDGPAGKGARAVKGRKVGGGGSITGGVV